MMITIVIVIIIVAHPKILNRENRKYNTVKKIGVSKY